MRLRLPFLTRRRADDIDISIREHLEQRADELVEEGASRAEAERRARREFGNVTLLTERSREAWQSAAAESLLRHLRFALRRLRRSPGFTAAVLLTLAVGLGANAAVFSVVENVLLKPLPYPEPNRLVALRLEAPGAGGLSSLSSGLNLSASMYLTFAQQNRVFRAMGIWTADIANVVRGGGHPEQVNVGIVSDGVLQALAVPALAGRWFTPAEQDPRGEPAVILSYGYWMSRLGGDAAAVGRTLTVDNRVRTIVGVMPRGFRVVDQDFDLLLPLAPDPGHQILAGFRYNGVARLRPGVPLAAADADLARLVPAWMDSWSNGPGTNPHYYEAWRIRPALCPLKQQVLGDVSGVLWLVTGTLALVMLIACVNVANLLLVNAEGRRHELAIRAALGAGRARIARSLLFEAALLGLAGGALAVVLAEWALRLLMAFAPSNLPRLSEVRFDGGALAFTLGLSLSCGLLCGLAPALRVAAGKFAGGAAGELGKGLREAGSRASRQRPREVLVSAQVALAVILMVAALLMARTFAALLHADVGFADAAQVQTMNLWIPPELAPDPRGVAAIQQRVTEAIAAVPGVSAAGYTADLPLDGSDPNWDQIQVEGRDYGAAPPTLRLFHYVSPGYFAAMGTRLLAGRRFSWDDLARVAPEVMVSDRFARETWGSAQAAIGRRIRKYSHSPWQQVIGVVEDVHVHGAAQEAPSIVYWPAVFYDRFSSEPQMNALRSVTFVAHSPQAGRAGFVRALEEAVWSVDRSLPLGQVSSMGALLAGSRARTTFALGMLALGAAMALSLSLLGIASVVAYSVSQQRREIGIRLALGAGRGLLQWMFVRRALVPTVAGMAAGMAIAMPLARLMRSMLFGVRPLDPISFLAVPALLASASMAASALPARRAARVEPAESLRAE
jgi:predicted permease